MKNNYLLTRGGNSFSPAERPGMKGKGSQCSRKGLDSARTAISRCAQLSTFAAVILLFQNTQAQNAFVERDLVSDIPGRAAKTDTNLVNPWA